jgi:heme exporter protein D
MRRINRKGDIEAMKMHEHALSYVWVAVGIVVAFYAWSWIQPMLGTQTAA